MELSNYLCPTFSPFFWLLPGIFSEVDATCSDFDFGTALHIAASNLCVSAVKCLLESGANPAFRVRVPACLQHPPPTTLTPLQSCKENHSNQKPCGTMLQKHCHCQTIAKLLSSLHI